MGVTTGFKKRSRINRPESGHYARASIEPGRNLWEFRLSSDVINGYTKGTTLDASMFKIGDKIDVTSFSSKGKGFQGCVKRHNFKMQDVSHGNSLSHRAAGSTG